MRNVSVFMLSNIMDTCAVWNLLSSARLRGAATRRKCSFALTEVVLYECLVKPRTRTNAHADELRGRLERARADGEFADFPLSLEDIQEMAQLDQRRRLGRGELASIAFAKRTGIAFCSDDRGAQKLAQEILGAGLVQTTPHLLGWLVFGAAVGDGEVELILEEHVAVGGTLDPHFRTMYQEGLRCRLLMASKSP